MIVSQKYKDGSILGNVVILLTILIDQREKSYISIQTMKRYLVKWVPFNMTKHICITLKAKSCLMELERNKARMSPLTNIFILIYV